jgi:hypothetical protein
LIGRENHVSAEKETIVPIAVLRQIEHVLTLVRKAAPDLDAEIVSACKEARHQLFSLLPINPKPIFRSTDGPSYETVVQEGFRFGARAVIENFSDCADTGRSSAGAFNIASEWLRRRRGAAFTKLVDGADPEFVELAKAFDLGLEQGLNEFLHFARKDHEDQKLAAI